MSTSVKVKPSLSTRVHEGIAWRLAKRSRVAGKHWRNYLTTQRLREAEHHNLVAAADIPGWLSADEAETLNHFARLAPHGHFLEIGSFCGRSSVILGGVIKERNDKTHRLFCCDPFGNVGKVNQVSKVNKWVQRKRSSFETFRHNILANNLEANVVTLAGKSDDVLPMIHHDFSFVFVDGAHDYDSVVKDISLVQHRVQPNGYLLFHDATTKAVGDAIQATLNHTQFQQIKHQSGSIAIYKRLH